MKHKERKKEKKRKKERKKENISQRWIDAIFLGQWEHTNCKKVIQYKSLRQQPHSFTFSLIILPSREKKAGKNK